MARRKIVRKPTSGIGVVDPQEEPSADWGWHGNFYKLSRGAGFLSAVALILMTIGNHQHNTENIWLIGIAAGLILLLALDVRKRRTAWRK